MSKRDLKWLAELPIGCIGSLSHTAYASRNNIIHNGYTDKCKFIVKDKPWCYLGWNDNLISYRLVSMSVLYEEEKWDIIVQPFSNRHNGFPYFLTGAMVSLNSINILKA